MACRGITGPLGLKVAKVEKSANSQRVRRRVPGVSAADGALAVSYLRVSTKEQAERGGRDEGFSLPAQREANQRKVESVGAIIVEEFIEPGESGASTDRPSGASWRT